MKTLLITTLILQLGGAAMVSSVTNAFPFQSNAAQAKKEYPNAKTQANELNEAVLAGKYEKAADLTYPRLVELMGGRARFIATMSRAMKEMQSETFSVLSTVAEDPTQTIVQGNNVFAILPAIMKIKVPEGVLVGKSFMIGASKDGGTNWTFIDGGSANRDQLKILFPTVADKFNLPESQRPVLQKTP